MVLKFIGVESIPDAERLVGCEVQIAASQRAQLQGGAQYVSDLVGCTVFEVSAGATELGAVADVSFGSGDAPLLVVREGTRELLLPFAQEFLLKVDIAARRIEMKLPQGLLDLDAPLKQGKRRG